MATSRPCLCHCAPTWRATLIAHLTKPTFLPGLRPVRVPHPGVASRRNVVDLPLHNVELLVHKLGVVRDLVAHLVHQGGRDAPL